MKYNLLRGICITILAPVAEIYMRPSGGSGIAWLSDIAAAAKAREVKLPSETSKLMKSEVPVW